MPWLKRNQISYGANPRGTINIDKCSRAVAWLDGRDYVTPDDIRFIVNDVLRHRLILSYDANTEDVNANAAIDELLKAVAVA
ncbi:AAA family ATPase [Mucilaginibacter sp. McL0603]|uniref:AAA family ATPase n=1 Tax=Mucilaginibacter sp. McL0603 TaxID=3415670 RepID=UPI003CFAB00C